MRTFTLEMDTRNKKGAERAILEGHKPCEKEIESVETVDKEEAAATPVRPHDEIF